MPKKITVADILKRVAKTDDIQLALIEVSYLMKITPFTMRHWLKRGIPDTCWGFFIINKHCTVEEIIEANKNSRKVK